MTLGINRVKAMTELERRAQPVMSTDIGDLLAMFGSAGVRDVHEAAGVGRGGVRRPMQRLPTIRRQPLSAEQLAHLAEIGRIKDEGRRARLPMGQPRQCGEALSSL